MSELRPVFGEIIEDYLAQLAAHWDDMDLDALGLSRQGDVIEVPYYHLRCGVTPREIKTSLTGLLDHSVKVVIAKYLLGPYQPPRSGGEAQWISFKQFKDAAPFSLGFVATVERKIAGQHAGKLEGLRKACLALGGREPDEQLSYDLCLEFRPLPKLPALLLFNDEEDGFPAQCSMLFKEDADVYLDMECIAILGISLAAALDPKLSSDT